MVTRLDRDFGRLQALLKELGLDEKTIVFFCSDNGGVERREGVLDSVGPFRGMKTQQFEGGLRVPMIVRWPGEVTAGKVDKSPWYFADVLPTLCEIGGVKVTGKIDGQSVLPTLLGKKQPELESRMMYWEQYSGGFQQAVRWGKWKGHYIATKDRFELYDLNVDQMEANDVASQFPDIAQKLRDFMAASHVPSPNWNVNAPPKNAKK